MENTLGQYCINVSDLERWLSLAIGVLIDTFIVRPFLVPAFTMMFWRGGAEEAVEVFPLDEDPPVRRNRKRKWEDAA